MSKSFDPFGDFEKQGYLQNSGGHKDPALVTRLETASFKANAERAALDLANRPLDYDSVLQTHKTLFSDAYPTWAGKDRAEVAPNLAVTKSGMDTHFAHPQEIKRAVDYGLNDTKAKAGDVYGRLAYAHPFLDGNGRTIMLVQDEVMRRRDKHIEWGAMDKREYLGALTDELRTPDKGIMDKYLDGYVKKGALTPQQSAAKAKALNINKPAKTPTMEELLGSLIPKIKDPAKRAEAQAKFDAMQTKRTI